eukprot:gene7138-8865_t
MERQPIQWMEDAVLPMLCAATRRAARFVNAPPQDTALRPGAPAGTPFGAAPRAAARGTRDAPPQRPAGVPPGGAPRRLISPPTHVAAGSARGRGGGWLVPNATTGVAEAVGSWPLRKGDGVRRRTGGRPDTLTHPAGIIGPLDLWMMGLAAS